MKCPTITKKKGSAGTCGAELQTKRTLANGAKVRRERVCPKCHARFWTVEQFEVNIAEVEFKHSEQVRIHAQETRDLQSKIGEYESLFLGFRNMMDKAARTVKK